MLIHIQTHKVVRPYVWYSFYRHTLAKTLDLIGERGADILYEGELGQMLIEDIRAAGNWLLNSFSAL